MSTNGKLSTLLRCQAAYVHLPNKLHKCGGSNQLYTCAVPACRRAKAQAKSYRMSKKGMVAA